MGRSEVLKFHETSVARKLVYVQDMVSDSDCRMFLLLDWR